MQLGRVALPQCSHHCRAEPSPWIEHVRVAEDRCGQVDTTLRWTGSLHGIEASASACDESYRIVDVVPAQQAGLDGFLDPRASPRLRPSRDDGCGLRPLGPLDRQNRTDRSAAHHLVDG